MNGLLSLLSTVSLLAAVVAAYWLPTGVAWYRRQHVAQVAVVNGLLGWTVIGWAVALVMALRGLPAVGARGYAEPVPGRP